MTNYATMNDPRIFVFDDFSPEDAAMTQALYSRDPASVLVHREKVLSGNSGSFMGRYYLNYGHASIGDCGSTTLYIENVSMLVAKAIQDSPLYNGQEASTRYLDFSKQSQYNPYDGTEFIPAKEGAYILKRWLSLYNKYLPLVVAGLKKHHPFDPPAGESEKIWAKAIDVRAFDICRSLLPIGTTTSLSWHTNLRQARDHLRYLLSHPLNEVRTVAVNILTALQAKYPHSFGDDWRLKDKDYQRYTNSISIFNHYIKSSDVLKGADLEKRPLLSSQRLVADTKWVNIEAINTHKQMLDRPSGTPLPRLFTQFGMYNLYFMLDFGSFRDIQRHRNGYCPIPVVNNDIGFFPGYDAEFKRLLSQEDYELLVEAMDEQFLLIKRNPRSMGELTDQYLYPMGMACVCHVSYNLPQMVYVSELRSGKTVHFTLRPIAQQMGRLLEELHPSLKLYVDYDEDSFSIKRGKQDIVMKESQT